MKRLDGRVALVTGAASGIGRATVERLASEGAVAVVTDVQDEAGEETAAALGGDAFFVHLDVTDEAGWQAAVERVLAERDRLDVLVNNAGLGDLAPIEETTLADWERTVAIDQTGVFLGMKSCGEALKASGHGSGINISSIFGTSGGFGVSPAYHAAKGAVRLLTKTTALGWAAEGVRVNSVHPGYIDTPILGDTDRDMLVGATPMGRLGQPEEIAAMITFLASDDASFTTGAEFVVDGGYTAG